MQANITAHQHASLWGQFSTAAALLGAEVVRAPSGEQAGQLLAALAPAPAATPTLLAAHPGLRSAGLPPLGTSTTSPAPSVASLGAFAVAETGSVAVFAANAERAACFLAERLWLVVAADDIVPTLDTALARIAARASAGARYATLVSGPSRTADIERTLTIGVHGPRALTIVVVGG